ncbi:MAG: hypothetical protein MUF31_10340 [Akkermansiaceae bacterium]|jgi:hypothetical protein|nr:hypothetical protein [Akkermansiaceae bacterium]
MKSQSRRILLACLVLIVAGIVRMPVEHAITRDFREQGLLKEALPLDTRRKLGQGLVAVSLGGLRSLVASMLHLRAYGFFENRRWDGVAETYDTIVQLAPNTGFYWDNGHWMMAYNAAAHHDNNYDNFAPARAAAEKRRWILKGTRFLEEGVRLNPDNARLWAELGSLYSNRFKIVDYDKSAAAFARASALPGAMPYMARFQAYAMARSPRLIDQALPLVRELRQRTGGSVPTLICLHFALEVRANPAIDPVRTAVAIFGDEAKAFRILSDYYLDAESGLPVDGVETALEALIVPLRDRAFQLARDPSKTTEVLDLVRDLHQGFGGSSAPLPALRLALEIAADPTMAAPDEMFLSWFDRPEQAIEALRLYQDDKTSGFPMNGIDEVLRKLEQSSSLPQESPAAAPDTGEPPSDR